MVRPSHCPTCKRFADRRDISDDQNTCYTCRREKRELELFTPEAARVGFDDVTIAFQGPHCCALTIWFSPHIYISNNPGDLDWIYCESGSTKGPIDAHFAHVHELTTQQVHFLEWSRNWMTRIVVSWKHRNPAMPMDEFIDRLKQDHEPVYTSLLLIKSASKK